MPPPKTPKIYHAVHVDRLPSIIADGKLWCDAEIARRTEVERRVGTMIGMNSIKQRRLNELTLASNRGLYVGQCVPFYFCARSVMLYVISRANHPELDYHGGQEPIVHLESDLREAVAWAEANGRRWAFTTSNAGSRFFDDYSDLEKLNEIDWDAVDATDWQNCKDEKQAEFLLEHSFPWELVMRIGVFSQLTGRQASRALGSATHRPGIEIVPNWYY